MARFRRTKGGGRKTHTIKRGRARRTKGGGRKTHTIKRGRARRTKRGVKRTGGTRRKRKRGTKRTLKHSGGNIGVPTWVGQSSGVGIWGKKKGEGVLAAVKGQQERYFVIRNNMLEYGTSSEQTGTWTPIALKFPHRNDGILGTPVLIEDKITIQYEIPHSVGSKKKDGSRDVTLEGTSAAIREFKDALTTVVRHNQEQNRGSPTSLTSQHQYEMEQQQHIANIASAANAARVKDLAFDAMAPGRMGLEHSKRV